MCGCLCLCGPLVVGAGCCAAVALAAVFVGLRIRGWPIVGTQCIVAACVVDAWFVLGAFLRVLCLSCATLDLFDALGGNTGGPHQGAPRLLFALSVLNVVGINANGIRTKRKRLMLHKLPRELRAVVGVITGTHMRRGELSGSVFPDYYIRGECCRPTPQGARIDGGVPILVYRGTTTEVMDKREELR